MLYNVYNIKSTSKFGQLKVHANLVNNIKSTRKFVRGKFQVFPLNILHN